MADTVYVRGSGGAIFHMDVPAGGHARERFDQQLDRGDLVVIDAVRIRVVEEPVIDARTGQPVPNATTVRFVEITPDDDGYVPVTPATGADAEAPADGEAPAADDTPAVGDAPASPRRGRGRRADGDEGGDS